MRTNRIKQIWRDKKCVTLGWLSVPNSFTAEVMARQGFDALLITYIGGVGTLTGPVLGAVFYTFLKEYLAVRWADFHLLIFGVLFMAIVLTLPGGLVDLADRARRGFARPRRPGPD